MAALSCVFPYRDQPLYSPNLRIHTQGTTAGPSSPWQLWLRLSSSRANARCGHAAPCVLTPSPSPRHLVPWVPVPTCPSHPEIHPVLAPTDLPAPTSPHHLFLCSSCSLRTVPLLFSACWCVGRGGRCCSDMEQALPKQPPAASPSLSHLPNCGPSAPALAGRAKQNQNNLLSQSCRLEAWSEALPGLPLPPERLQGSVSPPTDGAQRVHSLRCRPARTTTGLFVSICATAINRDIVAQRPGLLQPEPALHRPGLALPPGTPGCGAGLVGAAG